jgi:nickel-type superoxide dismutase maturation protease
MLPSSTIAPNARPGSRQDGAVLPLTRIRIVGPSMEPGLRNGDWWLARRTPRLRVGDVALIVHPLRPHALIVKRIVERRADGWWVLGDNGAASEDSRSFGTVPDSCVVGRLLVRYHPIRRT